MAESVIKESSFKFAIRVVKLHGYLIEEKKEFVLSKQLLRSGTAIGALVREAQNAESSADFVHKLSIAQKECDETNYWLELLHATNFLTDMQYESMIENSSSLLKMIRSAIMTTKQKNQSHKKRNP